MRILIIQERGRHPENREFREALNMSRALKRIKHEGVVWGLNYGNPSFEEIEKTCNAILLLENYETGSWIPDLSKSKKLKLFWSIDSHCVLDSHLKTCSKNKIDIVLCSIYENLKNFSQTKNYWFPNAYPDDLISPFPNTTKKWNIGFCGNILNRSSWLNHIQKYFDIRISVMKIGMEMVREINSYRIHWNRNISNDINYRTFETLGCGTLLFSNETDKLRELFDVNKHLVLYTNPDDLIDKIRYYLSHPKEIETIAHAGYIHAKSHHTFVNRARDLVKIIEENI